MTTLSLEFSSDRRSAAVCDAGRVLAESCVIAGRTTSAPDLIAAALRDAGLTPQRVRRLALGIGPGSYTGIRRAIATLQGWHLAHGIPIVAINSFDILAHLAVELDPGRVLLAADAQRSEWAVAFAEAGKVTEPIRLVPRAELEAQIAAGQRVFTPDANLIGSTRLFPTAAAAGILADSFPETDPTHLAAIYLREANFVKAPPPRILPD
jgi:tRNA threonylcarbamoyladenosine biosynthesis protein TsaB